MNTYYWYLLRSKDINAAADGEWLLACPDFPGKYISDEKLNTRTYRDFYYIKWARKLVETILVGLEAPIGQNKLPDYFCFRVDVE